MNIIVVGCVLVALCAVVAGQPTGPLEGAGVPPVESLQAAESRGYGHGHHGGYGGHHGGYHGGHGGHHGGHGGHHGGHGGHYGYHRG